MKKIVLTSLLAVFAVSGAQAANYFVGGSAGLSMDDTHTNIVNVAPEVGWKYNDNWDFGMGVNLGYTYNDDEHNDDVFNYGVNGFTRYKIAQFGDFKLLAKASVGANFQTLFSDVDARDGETTIGLSASVVPMITYDISEAFTLYANLNFMGVYADYNFENKNLDNAPEDWRFGFNVDSSNVADTGAFQIGFLYNF